MKNNILVLVGAVVGGVLGHFIFFWAARQGFYAMILPGAFVGLGAAVYKSPSWALPPICGVLALVAGILTEWRFAPFAADGSLGYFLTHLKDLQPMTVLLIGLGALFGFWVPFRRFQKAVKAG